MGAHTTTHTVTLTEAKLIEMTKTVDEQLVELLNAQEAVLYAAEALPTSSGEISAKLPGKTAKPRRRPAVKAKDAPAQAAVIKRETGKPFAAF